MTVKKMTTLPYWKDGSSSRSFAPRAFLVTAIMCLWMCIVSVWVQHKSLESSLGTSRFLPSIASSKSHNSHQWALDRGFGFSSAFADSLYTSFSKTTTTRRTAALDYQKCQPQRLHLTQATNVDGENRVKMTLSFTLPYKHCREATTTVVYGRGSFPEKSSSSSSNDEVVQFGYDASLAVPGLDDYQSDWIHHVTLSGLQAGRKAYWYRIVVVTTKRALIPEASTTTTAASQENYFLLRYGVASPVLGESPVHTFVTPPVPQQATSLAFVGDLGQTENSTKTLHQIYNAALSSRNNNSSMDGEGKVPPVSALVIAGDLSYSDGDPRRWESWLELMEPLLRFIPLLSIPGNHEIECDNTTHHVFEAYESYFRNPNRLGPADRQPIPDDYRRTLWSCLTSSEFLGHYNFGNAFWSVDHGLAKIIGLNSYTSTLPGSPQYTWLDEELSERTDRSVTPWLIVTFHCPLHTTFQGHNGEINSLLMLKSMEPLFVQYQVNFVVSGHDHAYLRTKPMQGGEKTTTTTTTGPIYWTLGAGGNREQHSKGYIHDIPEDWVEKRDISEYGFGHLHLPNATHAHLTWVRDGTTTEGIRDSVWLSNQLNDHHTEPNEQAAAQ